jgi:hypothetical protein
MASFAPTMAPVASAASPAPSGCTTRWYDSAGGSAPFHLLRTDPTALTLGQLRLGPSYGGGGGLAHGFLDFNADGRSDVFGTLKWSDGRYQWMYSSAGTGPWVKLAARVTPPADLRFGDFDGDGHTDVFTAVPNGGRWDWYFSSLGSGSYAFIATRKRSVADVRLAGDFNADDGTDWFFTTKRPDGSFEWRYVHYQASPISVGEVQLARAATPPTDLRFGDFDGDGLTDVFRLVRSC